ncbi:MAG: PcfB family protein, partial [Lachnospiraceae bacterium]|nr:PcfB family protein [Lachnospiraceae bacterium]
ANEFYTFNRTAIEGAAMVARVVIGSSIHFVKLTGDKAKNFVSAVVHSEKTGGKERFSKLLKSGEPLEIYSFTEEKMKLFENQAKRYGIVYCVVKRDAEDEKTGNYDVMVKKSDAGKLKRVFDKIGYATTKPDAAAEPISEEQNINNEPSGMTVTPEESRNLVSIMLEPDDRQMGDGQNPDLTAERKPLSADISPEKRTSVAKRMDNIKDVMKIKSESEQESGYSNIVNQMLSDYIPEDEDDKEKNNIADNISNSGSDISAGIISEGKESSL